MAQTANRDDAGRAAEAGKDAASKTVELTREAAGRSADAAKDATSRTVELTREATSRTADAAKDATERMAGSMKAAADRTSDTARRALGNGSRAFQTVIGVEGDFAKLWLDTAREQLQHNIDTVRRLSTVRDWREAAEIQAEFVRESMSRFAHLVTAQLEVGNAVSSRMVSLGQEEARRVS